MLPFYADVLKRQGGGDGFENLIGQENVAVVCRVPRVSGVAAASAAGVARFHASRWQAVDFHAVERLGTGVVMEADKQVGARPGRPGGAVREIHIDIVGAGEDDLETLRLQKFLRGQGKQ